jgi:hypothetical protein
VITIDLDTLTGRLRKAGILDVGRTRRFFTKAQLTAMALRDGGCVADGCDWPPWMCHAHHWIRWKDGGPTDLDNGGLLCLRTTREPTTRRTR